jgi:sec-independent protein translocase protein TatB
VFDLSLPKLLILVVIALVVFGPKELPAMAARAGRALRQLKGIAEGAKADLREGLGPEFSGFDIDDLNPRRFVQKHLFSEGDEAGSAGPGSVRADSAWAGFVGPGSGGTAPQAPAEAAPAVLADAPFALGGDAPFDADAT